MPLRIAFDLDGVLADMDGELARHAAELFGEAERAPSSDADQPPDNAPPLNLKLSARQQRRLWQRVQSLENFWGTLQELEPGAIKRLAEIAAERRWEVIFLTRRPESAGDTAQRQTQRWLEARGFSLPSVFVVQGSRGRIASALALDIVIDDRMENCLDVVADSKARAILVWRDVEDRLPTSAKRLGIGVVRSVSECLDILVKVDSPTTARAGIVGRVMRALGLKEPAGA
jgi:5' nucleotidase, deoxy (Pyrimidine), cytosolic type C protein (NT5C)